jgi:hypothetical protein
VGEKSWANICVLRANLMLFELISGLKVNFHKSLSVGVNISDSWLVDVCLIVSWVVLIPFFIWVLRLVVMRDIFLFGLLWC